MYSVRVRVCVRACVLSHYFLSSSRCFHFVAVSRQFGTPARCSLQHSLRQDW